MSSLHELIDDETAIGAACEDCDWQRDGYGAEEVRHILREADEHIKLGHTVQAMVG